MLHRLLFALLLFATLPATADNGEWVLHTTDYTGDYTGAAMANGTLGILPWREPFSVRHVILNHVFEYSDDTGVNRVLRGINPFPMQLSLDGRPLGEGQVTRWEQSIDMRHAVHRTSFTADGKARITCSLSALRNMPHAGMIEVEIEALKDVTLRFANRMDVPEGEYRTADRLFRTLWVDGRPIRLLRTDARTRHDRHAVSAASMFVCDDTQFRLEGSARQAVLSADMKAGEKRRFTLIGSICTSRDFNDPRGEAERQVVYMAHRTVPLIREGHLRAWDELWQGDIRIEGDDEAQRTVRFALFNLYSSCRAGSALSIPPMGLSMQGYNGHVFWDAELWMYPPLLLLNQDIARSMVDYRTDRMEAARRRAAAYGYRGVMFPWESDDAGEEATPSWAITGPLEHHITADVGIAAWNYYRVTRDREWLRKTGCPLLREIAEFWISRVETNDDGTYSIPGVVGADEYANNVRDNAFTNGAAMQALRAAIKASALCGEPIPALWREVADKLRILRGEDGVTLEFEGYAGQMIKQADVNLLAYPLGVIRDPEQILRDMEYYDTKIDRKNGPAMTYAIFTVNYARLGRSDKALELFRRSYRPHLRPPFGVLSETPVSHNPYFTTCAGGLLQAVLNGFAGLEITDRGIVRRRSSLPSSWRRLTVTGVGPERRTYVIE